MLGKTSRGASGTPTSAASSSVATSSSASQSACALPPARRGAASSADTRRPRAAPALPCATAYPPRSAGLSSGRTCD
eukprot:2425487-Pleurochrysis_carterae.AAC.1